MDSPPTATTLSNIARCYTFHCKKMAYFGNVKDKVDRTVSIEQVSWWAWKGH